MAVRCIAGKLREARDVQEVLAKRSHTRPATPPSALGRIGTVPRVDHRVVRGTRAVRPPDSEAGEGSTSPNPQLVRTGGRIAGPRPERARADLRAGYLSQSRGRRFDA